MAALRGVRRRGRLTGAVELPVFFVVPLVALAISRSTGFDLAGRGGTVAGAL